ncbi:MAG: hypothetical protein ACOYEF_05310 [Planifilum sp.]|jgi:hypothetical protein
MQAMNATDVRRHWGEFIDGVVRGRPQAVKRNRDHILAISLDHARELLNGVRFTMKVEHEEDGSVTGSLEGFDLVENAPDRESLRRALAKELFIYSEHYFAQFPMYFSSPNRRRHFPAVLRVQLAESEDEVVELID